MVRRNSMWGKHVILPRSSDWPSPAALPHVNAEAIFRRNAKENGRAMAAVILHGMRG
jgi:hypothetical protein